MQPLSLAQAVSDVPSLRGVFVTAMPDCLLYDAWLQEGEQWQPEDVASYFGDLVRANRQGLKGLNAWSSEMQVTIESAGVLLILSELRDFVVALAFDRAAPLGMVRVNVKRIKQRLEEILPQLAPEERPRAFRLLEFLEKYAPDPHAVLQRMALKTGIRLQQLQSPETIDEADVPQLESAVKEILGLETLSV